MELIAALIVFNCSGFGTQTDVYNHGTRETTASEIANKRITVEKITDSVFIDGNAYEAVIGNGDVSSLDDFKEIINETSCDAVMIGRAALGNPWIFKEIMSYYNNVDYNEPTFNEKVITCLNHIELLEKYKNETACINLSKKHIAYYIKSFKNSSKWRKQIMSKNSIFDIKEILHDMKKNYSFE